MNKVLILGVNGWIGSSLRYFLQDTYHILQFNRHNLNNISLENFVFENRPQYILNCMRGQEDYIFINLVNLCKNFDIKLIHFGSSAENLNMLTNSGKYGSEHKPSDYASKKMGESRIIQTNLDIQQYLIIKLFNVVGNSQPIHTALGDIAYKLLNSQDGFFTLSDYDIKRDYINLDTVNQFVEFSLKNNLNGVIELGCGDSIALYDVVNEMCESLSVNLLKGELALNRLRDMSADISHLTKMDFFVPQLAPSQISKMVLQT
jgi:nucleoside-diphosphate-sugar epimerase